MNQFLKRVIPIAGRAIPAIINGPVENREVVLRSGKTIVQQFAPMLSLRETNPANGDVTQYLATSIENLGWSPLRFNEVVGLDVDEHGATLTPEVLAARHLDQILARQTQFAAAGPTLATTGVDLSSEDEGE